MEMVFACRENGKVNIRYDVEREIHVSRERGPYESFAICAFCGEREVARFSDVSTSRESLASLAERCNRGELSLVHFPDIVEDFLLESITET